jgi:hypothetical protein
LLAHDRWFSPGTPASSTTKTGRHDIVEILLKVALSTINQIKSNQIIFSYKLVATFLCPKGLDNVSIPNKSHIIDGVSDM